MANRRRGRAPASSGQPDASLKRRTLAATLIRLEEASDSTSRMEDERIRAFVQFGLTTVLARRGMNPDATPQADFDLSFFVEVLRAMGENRPALLRILQSDLSEAWWWPEKD